MISEDSLEHSENGTQNAMQCPGFHPGSSSDATTIFSILFLFLYFALFI